MLSSIRTPRFFAFSLRVLLLAVTVFAIVLGLYVNRVHRQRTAAEKLRAKGYSVCYEHQYGHNPKPNSVPKWLEEIFGVDFFHTVYCVEFRTKPADRESIELINEFPNLRGLFIYTKEELSKETYKLISQFRSLDYLYLGVPPINAENFKELTVLKNIKTLYLTSTINDDVLKCVAEFDALEQLHINNKNISEEGIYQLHTLPHLKFIKLFGGYDVSSELKEKMIKVAIDDGSFSRFKHGGFQPVGAPAMPKTAADIGKPAKPVAQVIVIE